MHSFRSSRSLFQLRMAAMAWIGLTGAGVVAIGSGIYAFMIVNFEAMKVSIFCALLFAIMAIFYRIMAGGASCPLCKNQPLVSKGCQKHRKAQRVLGSHRFHVAGSVLFTASFRCPYCGESTACRVKPSSATLEKSYFSPHLLHSAKKLSDKAVPSLFIEGVANSER